MTNLVSYKEKINKMNITTELNKQQEKVNELYEKEGLTDRVLDLQIKINRKRHEKNIPDSNNFIFETFVQ